MEKDNRFGDLTFEEIVEFLTNILEECIHDEEPYDDTTKH